MHTYTAALPFPIKGGKLYLYNNNPLLIYHYPGRDRAEDRLHPDAAGKCLVATAERHGVRLGVVLLNSPDPATQAAHLLNAGSRTSTTRRPSRSRRSRPGPEPRTHGAPCARAARTVVLVILHATD